MGMKFDANKLKRQVAELAQKHILKAMEEAKREMGEDGKAITITKSAALRQVGSKMEFAGLSFPSQEVADRFSAIVKRKLK